MASHHAQLHSIVVGARMHELPGPVRDGAGVLTGGLAAEPLDELKLERLYLALGIAGSHLRQRLPSISLQVVVAIRSRF